MRALLVRNRRKAVSEVFDLPDNCLPRPGDEIANGGGIFKILSMTWHPPRGDNKWLIHINVELIEDEEL